MTRILEERWANNPTIDQEALEAFGMEIRTHDHGPVDGHEGDSEISGAVDIEDLAL
jgi:hypothetical protein